MTRLEHSYHDEYIWKNLRVTGLHIVQCYLDINYHKSLISLKTFHSLEYVNF